MLTDDEFCTWCQQNTISPQTEAAIARIRSSQPVRKVRSGASNVSGRFPSVKMGFSIQFESQRVELWAIYAMEMDDDVLECYDQPTRIQLHYHAHFGRNSSPWHTPDFLVIRWDGVAFEEWKPADALDKLAERIPECYQPTGMGAWRSPPGEAAAQALGFSYRVRPSNEYHPVFIQNLKILEAAKQTSVPDLHSPSPSSFFLFDGRLWDAEVAQKDVLLQPEVGTALTIAVDQFHYMIKMSDMKQVAPGTPSPLQEATRERFLHAGPKAQEAATRRWREILAYRRGKAIRVTQRSIQNWMAAYRQAGAETGCGYLGLLDRVAHRGNRTLRVLDASRALLREFLSAHYAAPQAKRAAAVYRLYREEVIRQGLPPVGERTFYHERAHFTDQEVTMQRQGKRAAYASQQFLGYLNQTTPRHGERPFARAHLDHTQLDILLVSSVTGKPLAKPWATFLVDAYSRWVLACTVTYDPLSYRSAMMVLRLCVQHYGRLPQDLVVDHGSEFHSVYFESLPSHCFVTELERPPSQPHFGSVIERLFRMATTELLNQLRGNTQASKTPRQMTHDIDSKRLAVWTLEHFARRLTQYVHEAYDQMDHPALDMSPRESFEQGMLHPGSRAHMFIPYSEAFLIQTRPSTRTGVAKIHPARGITVNGLQYWHECMRSPLVVGKVVPENTCTDASALKNCIHSF